MRSVSFTRCILKGRCWMFSDAQSLHWASANRFNCSVKREGKCLWKIMWSRPTMKTYFSCLKNKRSAPKHFVSGWLCSLQSLSKLNQKMESLLNEDFDYLVKNIKINHAISPNFPSLLPNYIYPTLTKFTDSVTLNLQVKDSSGLVGFSLYPHGFLCFWWEFVINKILVKTFAL